MSRPVSLIVVEGALEVPASLRILEALKISSEGLFPVNKGGRINFWATLQSIIEPPRRSAWFWASRTWKAIHVRVD